MAAFDIGKLVSRTVRSGIGSRTFSAVTHGFQQQQSGAGGIISAILGLAGSFTNFILGGLWNWLKGFLSWSASELWSFLIQGVQFLWSFDWNQSDEQLDKSLEGAWDGFGGVLGDFTGYAFGSLISMGTVALGAQLFAFDEALAIHILREMGEDALQQLTARASMVLQALAPLVLKSVATYCYKQLRSLFVEDSSALYPSDDKIKQEINNQVKTGNIRPEDRDRIEKNWLEQTHKGKEALNAKRKPWSFAHKYEEWKERIPSAFWRNFADQAFNSFTQAIMDQGYVAIHASESYTANHQAAHAIATGTGSNYTVQVNFNGTPTASPTPSPAPAPAPAPTPTP